MKVTKKQKEEAGKIFASNSSITELFVNKNSEFFTNQNLASNSVKGKKSDYARVNKVSVEVAEDDTEDFDVDAIKTVDVVEEGMTLKGDDFELLFTNIKGEVREPKEGDVAEVDGKPADGVFVYEGTTMGFKKGTLDKITFKEGTVRSFFKKLVG